MTFFKKISYFLKRKYIWIPLLVISVFLQFVGIAALIGISSYRLKPINSSVGSWQYSYELSEKAALDTWQKDTEFIRHDPVVENDTTYGEFRTFLRTTKDQTGKEVVKAWSNPEGYAIGFIYIDGKKYAAHLFSQTGEVTFDQNESFERPKWQWYHWLGLRPPQWYLDYGKYFFEK